MEARQERAVVIAAMVKLTHVGGSHWVVPSQTAADKKYLVDVTAQTCTCPDHQEAGHLCKHVRAVQIVIKREQHADGSFTETRTVTFTEQKKYRQDWAKYNLAQST